MIDVTGKTMCFGSSKTLRARGVEGAGSSEFPSSEEEAEGCSDIEHGHELRVAHLRNAAPQDQRRRTSEPSGR